MDRQEWRELQRAVARLVRDAVAPLERKLMLVASKAVVELVRDGLGMHWGYEAPENNACDAYALAQLGLAWLTWRAGGQTSQAIAKLLTKLEAWPPRPN